MGGCAPVSANVAREIVASVRSDFGLTPSRECYSAWIGGLRTSRSKSLAAYGDDFDLTLPGQFESTGSQPPITACRLSIIDPVKRRLEPTLRSPRTWPAANLSVGQNPKTLNWQVWRDDRFVPATVPDKEDAEAAAAVIRREKYTAVCLIGSGDRIFRYFDRAR